MCRERGMTVAMRRRATTFVPLSVFFLIALLHAGVGEALTYQVFVPLMPGASVRAMLPDGRAFDLGKVVGLPTSTRWPSYTVSKWAEPGTVAASAVNAIHLTVAVEKGEGRTMSILPLQTVAPAAGDKAFITIDVPAGTGLFGGWAPPVGTRVLVMKENGDLLSLRDRGFPAQGEVLLFEVEEEERPYIIDIENRPGGRIIGWYARGPYVLARVLHPVRGTGRFDGTVFQGIGRLRANHSGVIDISTSRRGVVGGFQIIPFTHAKSKEMASAWQLTQWMIVASESDTPLPGTAPLFKGDLVPGSQLKESLWDMWSTYGRKPLILCRRDGGPWTTLPEKGGRNDLALQDITHLRIYSPFTKEPQS